jgi:hypothetical protein
MKKCYSLLFALAVFSCVKAQNGYDYSEVFHDCYFEQIIDSLNSQESGIWQIAIPDKPTINSASYGDQSLLTDSVNSYPVLDSSRFYFATFENGGFYYHHTFSLSGSYWSQTDSLNDFGTIELKLPRNPEYGWINILNDSLPDYNGTMQFIDHYVHWSGTKPVLTGNSNGWQSFNADMIWFYEVMNFQVEPDDTLMFRFTFHSDSVADTLDGLAFDELTLCNLVEGIDELEENWFFVSPNPFSEIITVSSKKKLNSPSSFKIRSALGSVVVEDELKSPTQVIHLEMLQSGVYFMELFNETTLRKEVFRIIKN